MLTIYKYRPNDPIPMFATPLHVAFHNGELFIWMEVDTTVPTRRHGVFKSVITGGERPAGPDWQYVGTAITPDGSYAFHVYFDTRP